MDATITPAGPFCTNDPAVALDAVDNGGTWSGTGITNASLGIFDPSIALNGTHTITYTIGGACGDVQTINIVVTDQVDATINPVGQFCVNDPSITLSALNGGGTWSGPGITNGATGTFSPINAGAGTHTITYSIPGSCGDTQTTTVIVNPLPVVSFSVDNASGCVPVTATFSDNSGSSGATAEWTMSDGFVSTTSGSVTHTFNSSGCFNVTLELTSSAGCISSSTQNNIVCVSAIPVAEFIWSPENATILNPTVNFVNTSTGATDYFWDFAGLGTSINTNPSFAFPGDSANTYMVCVISSNIDGCSDTVCHDILIYDEYLVYVPNTFTPDNDGVNDVFIPIINGYNPLSYEFLIFNRWGELIFQTENPFLGWDGTFKSLECKEDTYVWKVSLKSTFDNKVHEYIGHVNLLR
jgi:gliding motility-associated-like protein